MFDRIAYCGLDCSNCPVYQATIENDSVKRKNIADLWSSSKLKLKPEDIYCDGCTCDNGRLFCYGGTCEIRLCARNKGIRNCAWCGHYPCEKLVYHYNLMDCRGGWERLDQIREDIIN